MSSVLPLEVLGLMGPILCWVEDSRMPGLPESWHSRDFPFKERIRNWLVHELPTYSYDSLDEIISLAGDRRVDFYFPMEQRRSNSRSTSFANTDGFDLTCTFSQLSKRYFQWAGNELCIREGRLLELHELAMRFPVRHLIQYCYADAVVRSHITTENALQLPPQMSQLHTTYHSLRTIVDKGLFEGHLHLNGVINADESWCDHLLLRMKNDRKNTFSAENGRLLHLSRTAVRLLAVGLIYLFINPKERNLPHHLIDKLDKMYRAKTVLESQNKKSELQEAFLCELKELRKVLNKESSRKWDKELEWLIPLANSNLNLNLSRGIHSTGRDDTFEEIGIRARLRLLNKLHLNVNRILIERNTRNPLLSSGDDSHHPGHQQNVIRPMQDPIRDFLHQLSYRYLVYHTHHWQNGTQSGKTTGLRKFQFYYSSPQREFLSENQADVQGLAIERLSMAKPLRAVEGRLSPPSTGPSKYLPWVLAFAQQVKDGNLDKFGIIVHFKKDNFEKKKFKTAKTKRMYLRNGKIRRLTRNDAVKLFRLLSTPHPVVPFIIGIDAANLELTTPPEVFAPAFRFLKEYPIKLHRRSSTKEKFGQYDDIAALVKKRRLGMTYHVGEDFRHLLSGLRAIHEVIEFLKPLPGDRLGHAIALALSPEIWAAQVGYQAVMPRLEWLDTLVWLHYLLGPGHDLIGELAIEDHIQLHSREIYKKSASSNDKNLQYWKESTPTMLYDSWRLRQIDPYSVDLSECGKFKIRQRADGSVHRRWADVQTTVLNEVDRYVGSDDAYELVKKYWLDPGVRDRGQEIVTFDIQDQKDIWLQVFNEAQERVQNMVRDKQLVVEVNPTSNRYIGPMESMADHPIFQLTLNKQQEVKRQIRVTINTDDPGVFDTSLSHEFYLMGESLLKRGLPEPQVVEWLEWLRKNGSEYSFLHGLADANNKHMKSLLDCLLKKYSPLLQRLKGKRKKYRPSPAHLQSKPLKEEIRQLKLKLRELEENM